MVKKTVSLTKKDKNPTGGLSQAGRDKYNRATGANLKPPVTGKPKPGSKDEGRKKSFCARSNGQKNMHNIDCSKTPEKRICLARRKWKC
jgi:hypothetical protein